MPDHCLPSDVEPATAGSSNPPTRPAEVDAAAPALTPPETPDVVIAVNVNEVALLAVALSAARSRQQDRVWQVEHIKTDLAALGLPPVDDSELLVKLHTGLTAAAEGEPDPARRARLMAELCLDLGEAELLVRALHLTLLATATIGGGAAGVQRPLAEDVNEGLLRQSGQGVDGEALAARLQREINRAWRLRSGVVETIREWMEMGSGEFLAKGEPLVLTMTTDEAVMCDIGLDRLSGNDAMRRWARFVNKELTALGRPAIDLDDLRRRLFGAWDAVRRGQAAAPAASGDVIAADWYPPAGRGDAPMALPVIVGLTHYPDAYDGPRGEALAQVLSEIASAGIDNNGYEWGPLPQGWAAAEARRSLIECAAHALARIEALDRNAAAKGAAI